MNHQEVIDRLKLMATYNIAASGVPLHNVTPNDREALRIAIDHLEKMQAYRQERSPEKVAGKPTQGSGI